MADRYLVATGDWNDTATWSDSDGGDPGVSHPTSSDNVYCTATSGVVTLTINTGSACLDFDCTGFTGTLQGSYTLGVYGNYILDSGMTLTSTGTLYFYATGAVNVDTDGVVLKGSVTFAGTGTYTLLDTFSLDGFKNTLTLSQGTLDTNGQTTYSRWFYSYGSLTRTLTLGASEINSMLFHISTDNLTFNPGTSNVKMDADQWSFFNGGGNTFATVTVNNPDYAFDIRGANTFGALTIIGDTHKTGVVELQADQIVTGTFTCNGNSATNRVFLCSDDIGTARTITAATVSVSNTDFQDITGAGAGSWDLSGVSSGDCGGNTDITFTTADSMYWHVDGGFVSAAGNWFLATDGGGGAGRVPLPQDTAIFDANSFDTGGQTVSFDMPRIGGIDASAATDNPTFNYAVVSNIYGSLVFASGMSSTGVAWHLKGRGAYNFTPHNSSSSQQNPSLDAYGGTYTLQNNFTHGQAFYVKRGTFDANDKNVQLNWFYCAGSYTREIIMGSGNWTIKKAGQSWNMNGSNYTVTCETSTIIFDENSGTQNFDGGNETYYDFEWTGLDICVIEDSNTFHDFTVSNAAATELQFVAGTTTTVTSFNATGTEGNIITITGKTASTYTISDSSGINSCDYLDISYSIVSGGASWVAGIHSIDSGNNTGWEFVRTKTFTADAILTSVTTETKTFTADAFLEKTQTKTFDVNAILQKTFIKTFKADAVLKATEAKTFKADALLEKTETKTLTADAILQKTEIQTYTCDALLQSTQTKTITSDAILQSGRIKTFKADALLKKTQAKTFSTDAFLQATQIKEFIVDALLSVTQIKTFILDALLRKTQTKTFDIDAFLRETNTKTIISDALLQEILIKSFSADVLLKETGITKAITADALLRTMPTKTFSCDAFLVNQFTKTFTIDAILIGAFTKTFTADIIIAIVHVVEIAAVISNRNITGISPNTSISATTKAVDFAARVKDTNIATPVKKIDLVATVKQIEG